MIKFQIGRWNGMAGAVDVASLVVAVMRERRLAWCQCAIAKCSYAQPALVSENLGSVASIPRTPRSETSLTRPRDRYCNVRPFASCSARRAQAGGAGSGPTDRTQVRLHQRHQRRDHVLWADRVRTRNRGWVDWRTLLQWQHPLHPCCAAGTAPARPSRCSARMRCPRRA